MVEEDPCDGVTLAGVPQREAGAQEVVVRGEGVPPPADEPGSGDLPGRQQGEDSGDEVVWEPREVRPSRRHRPHDPAAASQGNRDETRKGQAHIDWSRGRDLTCC